MKSEFVSASRPRITERRACRWLQKEREKYDISLFELTSQDFPIFCIVQFHDKLHGLEEGCGTALRGTMSHACAFNDWRNSDPKPCTRQKLSFLHFNLVCMCYVCRFASALPFPRFSFLIVVLISDNQTFLWTHRNSFGTNKHLCSFCWHLTSTLNEYLTASAPQVYDPSQWECRSQYRKVTM